MTDAVGLSDLGLFSVLNSPELPNEPHGTS